jgi:hypothetical protein
MTTKIITEQRLDVKPLVIGPRVEADVRRRVRELESRFKPSHADLRELSKLREFLQTVEADDDVQP